jgi:hypothetical protein
VTLREHSIRMSGMMWIGWFLGPCLFMWFWLQIVQIMILSVFGRKNFSIGAPSSIFTKKQWTSIWASRYGWPSACKTMIPIWLFLAGKLYEESWQSTMLHWSLKPVIKYSDWTHGAFYFRFNTQKTYQVFIASLLSLLPGVLKSIFHSFLLVSEAKISSSLIAFLDARVFWNTFSLLNPACIFLILFLFRHKMIDFYHKGKNPLLISCSLQQIKSGILFNLLIFWGGFWLIFLFL